MSEFNADRRNAVKKLGIGAGAAWVAPVVTGLVVPRHASALSTCDFTQESLTVTFHFDSTAFDLATVGLKHVDNIDLSGLTVALKNNIDREGTTNTPRADVTLAFTGLEDSFYKFEGSFEERSGDISGDIFVSCFTDRVGVFDTD